MQYSASPTCLSNRILGLPLLGGKDRDTQLRTYRKCGNLNSKQREGRRDQGGMASVQVNTEREAAVMHPLSLPLVDTVSNFPGQRQHRLRSGDRRACGILWVPAEVSCDASDSETHQQ